MEYLLQDLRKFKLPNNFRGRAGWFVQIWWLIQSTLFKPSPQFLYPWRRWLLRLFGAKIGQGVLIRPSVTVTYPWKVRIGDWSWIGDNVVLYSLGEIDIGSNTVISQRSYICAAGHDYTKLSFDIYSKNIKIGSEVWIAADAFVGPGVIIKEGAVIFARSTVINDVEEKNIVAGNPAKPINTRTVV